MSGPSRIVVSPATRILVAGARGFVGAALCPALQATGIDVLRGMRPDFDVDDDASVRRALHGRHAAYWLVHGLRRSGAYDTWELDVATRFARHARDAGVQRIVYLGGIEPRGARSKHMDARLRTGEALRSAGVPVVELRAGMIIGAGSESWRLLRDTAARLPRFAAPPWMRARHQPVAIDDVTAALVAAVALPPGIYDVPGPETMTGRMILARIATLLGRTPRFTSVPLLPRRLAGRLAPLVTRTDPLVARELLRGAGPDFVCDDDGVFQHLPGHVRIGFDEAAQRAFTEDDVPWSGQLIEALVRAWDRRASDRRS